MHQGGEALGFNILQKGQTKMNLKMTRHFQRRMAQRGNTKQMIDLVFQIGEIKGDKLISNKKIIKKYLLDLDRKILSLSILQKKFKHLNVVGLINKAIEALFVIRRTALKILDKGGITVVCHNDALITTYNTNSFVRY
jgi:hypothetical protein